MLWQRRSPSAVTKPLPLIVLHTMHTGLRIAFAFMIASFLLSQC